MSDLRTELEKTLERGACGAVRACARRPRPIALERPKQAAHGDYASNVALALAKRAKQQSARAGGGAGRPRCRPAARRAKSRSRARASSTSRSPRRAAIDRQARCSPKARAFGKSQRARGRARDGRVRLGQSDRSAARRPRPAGGAGRRDRRTCSSRRAARVTREFYYNDAGQQIQNLAISVRARAQEILGEHATFPEDGYHGEYIRELAQRYLDEVGPRSRATSSRSANSPWPSCAREQDRDLMAFGVTLRQLLPRKLALHRRPRRRDRRAARRVGQDLRAGGRAVAAARRTTATTRTASCASPTAATRTSCPTSPIT